MSSITTNATNPNVALARGKLSLDLLDRITRQSVLIRDHELPQFRSLFSRIVAQLTEEPENSAVDHSLFSVREDPQIELAHRWLRDVMQYNVPHGKLIRGLSLTINYQILAKGYEAMASNGVSNGSNGLSTDEITTAARILGWCVEMFQAYFLVLDDMMDGSITRRGQPCWYRNVSVTDFTTFMTIQKNS